MQAHLGADVRQEMADRLCALEPISRHDIGQNSYRIKQVFEEMGGLRVHLASMNPYLSAGQADIEALRVRYACCARFAGHAAGHPLRWAILNKQPSTFSFGCSTLCRCAAALRMALLAWRCALLPCLR